MPMSGARATARQGTVPNNVEWVAMPKAVSKRTQQSQRIDSCDRRGDESWDGETRASVSVSHLTLNLATRWQGFSIK